jgi:competence ComEA-like helix-hairpin-helix protein
MDIKNEKRQETGALTAVFFAGLILNLCFAFAILQYRGQTTFAQIEGKLNPNTASAFELAELPNLGPGKAKAITEYRQGKKKAFENSGDLEKVKGIGEKTAEKIKQWMKFE